MPHFIFCEDYYYYNGKDEIETLKYIILDKMRKYGIQTSILTMLNMFRLNLITKENAKKVAEGKLINDEDWEGYEGSINDDLERFLINFQGQKEVKYERVLSFFTPELQDKELKLVQEPNEEHMMTYFEYHRGHNPDVDVEEMKKSDSESKYVHCCCTRITFPLSLKKETA